MPAIGTAWPGVQYVGNSQPFVRSKHRLFGGSPRTKRDQLANERL